MKDSKDLITIVISLISLIVPSYFFMITSSEEIKTQTYVIFIGTLIILILSVFIVYIYSKWKNLVDDVKQNKIQIKDTKRDLNLKNLFSSIDKRLAILEMLFNKKRNKKAQIDPRIIIWIILIILLILFLKSIGIFG